MNNNALHPYRKLVTPGYHGYSLKFSPFEQKILAVVGAENYGIQGTGTLVLFDIVANYPVIKKFTYQDALFDVCWTRSNPDFAITGAGNGAVQIWSITNPYPTPMAVRQFHKKEISSVDCSLHTPHQMAMSSWDSQITVCEINSFKPLCVLKQDEDPMVYEARWSHLDDKNLVSVSSNGCAYIWSPLASPKPCLLLPRSNTELLSCDWSHDNPNIIVTAGANAVVNGWDLRFPSSRLFELRGHQNAIRKVRFSPFITEELTTVSYDFTTRLWNIASPLEVDSVKCHYEFAYGIDYSLLLPGVVADCAWDQTIQVYKIGPPEVRPESFHSALANQSNFSLSTLLQNSSKPLPPPPPSSDAHTLANTPPLPLLPPPKAHMQPYKPLPPPPISYRPPALIPMPHQLVSSSQGEQFMSRGEASYRRPLPKIPTTVSRRRPSPPPQPTSSTQLD